MRVKFFMVGIGLVLLLVFILVFYILPYFRFCLEKGRVLSDKELIDLGVEELMIRPVSSVSFPRDNDGYQYQPAYPIYYKSKEEFFSENPDCCVVLRRKGFVSISTKYKVKYLDVKGNLHSSIEKGIVFLNYCGRSW